MQTVEIDLRLRLRYPVDDIGRLDLRNHVKDAVKWRGGSLHPELYLFDAVETVTTGPVKVIR